MLRSVGVSISPCEDAARLGYDDRQINRIVIRIARYFLEKDMRVIFGHDWREDGVMRAVADFANVVASRNAAEAEDRTDALGDAAADRPLVCRMVNLVATRAEALNRAAVNASEESGDVLVVLSVDELLTLPDWPSRLGEKPAEAESLRIQGTAESRPGELTYLRAWLTALLAPGCRICLGGKMRGYQGDVPGVIEEAGMALRARKPLYLLGGLGGATRAFIESPEYARMYGSETYWHSANGLDKAAKERLFETVDVEYALRLVTAGIAASVED